MIKTHKWQVTITSIVVLLPALAGLLLWNRLPDSMATHFNAEGVADGWSSRAFAVLGIPAYSLGLHWLCLLLTAAGPKSENIRGKAFSMMIWLCPVISIFSGIMTIGYGLNRELNIAIIAPAASGLLFLIVGNYLPKCRQNYYLGFKLPWTLNSEENWNRTHRVAGKVMMVSGLLLLGNIFLGVTWVYVVIIVLMVLIPGIYSYWYYRTKEKNHAEH